MTANREVQRHTFFSSQTVRWLDEPWQTPEDRRRFLQPSAFRIERPGAAQVERQNVGNWRPVDRSALIDWILADNQDWRRIVFTTDAGIGKSTNLEWLWSQINERRGRMAAFLLNMTDLQDLSIDAVLGRLLEQFRQAKANSTLHLPPHADLTLDAGWQMFEQWRRFGMLTLILDGLDQALPRQIAILRELLQSDAWQECRFALGGRPHALQTHWADLFTDAQRPFQFVRLDEFTPEQQQAFLGRTADGKSRWHTIPEEAHGILSVPRVLDYLRDHVSDGELSRIKTASDVYWKSTQHMVKEALAKSVEARRIGLPAGEQPSDKPRTNQIETATKLLAAVAYGMTSQRVTDTDPASETCGRQVPNFSMIEPKQPFADFRRTVAELMCHTPQPTLQDQSLIDQWLDALGAANDAVASGFYDSDTIGLDGILWRNRTLQEFFTALWCAAYATPEQSRNLWDWLYVAGDITTEPFYWVNRFLAEMPEKARKPPVWVESLEPVYRPGDGTPEGTRRSTEMLFRSWRTMHELAGVPVFDWWDCSYEELIEAEGQLKQGAGPAVQRPKVPRAKEVLDAFQGEFQRILAGTHPACASNRATRTPKDVAEELTKSFIPVEAGEFRMGAPEEKQGMGAEQREFWAEMIAELEYEDAQAIIRRVLPRDRYEAGSRGDQGYEDTVAYWADLLAMRDVDAIESQQYAKNETPEKGEEVQQVAGFSLGKYPTLTEWYRLFAPGHGDSQEWYGDQFRKISQTPRDPVIYLSWWDAWAFSQWLAWGTGDIEMRCRLPHEPEFEYVAKVPGDWKSNYWWGDVFQKGEEFNAKELGQCNGYNRLECCRPPEDATPNARGFHDLLGNVCEWMANRYRGKYSRREPPDEVYHRVVRGGAWDYFPTYCRSAFRGWSPPDVGVDDAGCRLVCFVCVRTS